MRATLPERANLPTIMEQVSQASPVSIVETQANHRPNRRPQEEYVPVRKPEDEYDIDSPHFGMEHTPEWDDLGIDIDDQSQGRWFPPPANRLSQPLWVFEIAAIVSRLTIDHNQIAQWRQRTL